MGEITLFYRRKIIDEIGFYDSVRFGADSEFVERICKKYKVGTLNSLTYLAKTRQNSLTTSAVTGNNSVRIGYIHRYRNWHNKTEQLYMPYPLINRPFGVDNVMLP